MKFDDWCGYGHNIYGICCYFFVIYMYIGGLVQDCSISGALAIEILQSCTKPSHYIDVIMSAMAQITGVSIVYSTVCSGADQRKHQSSASVAFVRGIHR